MSSFGASGRRKVVSHTNQISKSNRSGEERSIYCRSGEYCTVADFYLDQDVSRAVHDLSGLPFLVIVRLVNPRQMVHLRRRFECGWADSSAEMVMV